MSSQSIIPASRAALSSEERWKILYEWNRTEVQCDTDRCIHWLFEERAAASPLAVAIDDGESKVSYGELNEWANQLAHLLSGKGVGPGEHVGVCMDRSANLIVALLGILKCGAAYVPIEPGWPDERIGFIARTLNLRGMIVDPERVERMVAIEGEVKVACIGKLGIGEVTRGSGRTISWRDDLPKQNLPRVAVADDRAYVIFTSGSSGDPKGVVVRHRPVINLIDWVKRAFGVGVGDQILFTTSVAFDLSVYDIFGILAAGGRIRIASSVEVGDPERVAEILCREEITIWNSAPAAMERICPFLCAGGGGERLRLVFLSGDWIPLGLAPVIRGRFPRVRIVGLGGATEATVWSNYHEIEAIDPGWVSIPYGRPIQNARYYVLNSDREPCSVGTAGELYIGGMCLADGYANDPELTRRKFIADPFVKGERMYRTGDRARYFSDGKIEFLGRVDRQVKIRGYRVEPGEIEAEIGRHAGVQRAVVVADGEANCARRLVAYVVLTDPSRAKNAANKLRSHLRRRLPEFMVPARMEIVRALPLSRNGKIDLAALQSGVSRLPEVRAESCVAARNETERVLGVVWCRTLGLARVGIDENFFELGGDSLQSVQMITAAGGIGLNLRISDLHECPTIRQLALRVRRVGPRPESLTLNHDIPLTPTQRWFFDRPLRYPERYNAVFAFDVLNGVSVDHLRIAWKQVVQHHDALRMRFCRANGVWRQFAALNDANDLTVWDLSDLSERAQLAEVERRVTGVRVGFDLDHGPSARAFILIRGGGKPARLMLVLHHLVFDAISLGVLAQDMTWAIEQLQQQKPVRLPECGSFAEWAIGLSKLAESASVQAERAYWLGLPWGQVTPLPRDVWDGENKYGSIGTMRAQLSKAETCALLRELPSCCRASVGEILLAACLRVLSRWAKTRTLLVDLTVHGRHDAFGEGSASRMMGYLTCNIPVVVTVSPESSLAQLACGVRDHLRRMPSQGMGFGMLRYLSPDDEVAARLRECPQAEVKFNYLGSLVAAGAMTGLFRPAKTTEVGVLDPRDERAYLHNLELAIVDESLEIEWKYSGAIHRAKTIESLLGQLMSAVRQMIGEATSAKELVDRDVCGGGLR